MQGQLTLPLFEEELGTSLQIIDVTEPEPADDSLGWSCAADVADELGVSVRHVRRLATAGLLERRRFEEKSVYRIAPTLPEPEKVSSESTSRCKTNDRSPDTHPRLLDEHTGSAEIPQPPLEPPPAKRTDETIIISSEDVEFLGPEELVSTELLATNRELMKLVDGVLSRWTEVTQERGRASDSLHTALDKALQLQQCLGLWQHHAAALEREMLQNSFTTTRALDLADEAVSLGWSSFRRRRALKERLEGLRTGS